MAVMKAVTIHDVAARAGVSVGTASRVLTGHPSTSERSRDLVTKAAADLGYRANARAGSLRSAHTDTIGVLVSDIRNPFFADIAEAVEQKALLAGLATIMCNADESAGQQDRYIDLLVNQRVDGIIMAPQGDGSGKLSLAREWGIPLVFVDRVIDGSGIPSVTSDNSGGIRQAVNRLAELGHRRIGYIAGPLQTSTGRERLAAFKGVAGENGIDPSLVFVGDFRYESGVAGAEKLLEMADPPTAIIAADSLMTLGAALICRQRGVRIPDELSLIGYDDVPAFSLLDPPLTVIAHDPTRMGELAFDMLMDVEAGRPAESIVLPTALIERGSIGPVAQHEVKND